MAARRLDRHRLLHPVRRASHRSETAERGWIEQCQGTIVHCSGCSPALPVAAPVRIGVLDLRRSWTAGFLVKMIWLPASFPWSRPDLGATQNSEEIIEKIRIFILDAPPHL